jgi:heterodisulfide reductase subunit A
MKRVGVFLCWCGSNIAGTVDVGKVAEQVRRLPGVVYVEENKYTCSEPGQASLIKAVKERKLDRVVVASCSPRLHEPTFRRTVEAAGLNPYFFEMANVREHCSWVHPDKETATPKAFDIVRKAVAKALRLEALSRGSITIEKKALVVGGGIAGIQAALDIADAGHKVILLEREPTIGGRMAQLDKTFPTLDCSSCILTPKMVDAAKHPNITLYSYSELEKVEGYIGNFTVTIRKKARGVDEILCTGCGMCQTKCPTKVPSEFDEGMGQRKAIYSPFPQAVPNKPVIDRVNCTFYKTGKCKICEKFCEAKAIRFDQEDTILEEKVGAIVMATGFDLFDVARYGEYGYGLYPNVITSLQLERLINASGPTEGKIKKPSDHEIPKSVAFILCVGSRDEQKGTTYCSRACCMYSIKHAMQYRDKVKDGRAYVFYMDIRTPGKSYEEFYKRAAVDYGVEFIRGRPSKIYGRGGKLIVKAEDTLLGRPIEVEVEMVVLAPAMVSRHDAAKMAQTLSVSYDGYGFLTEAHPKLRPVETNTAGIFLAGACQGPKDIPDTVAQASAAGAKVIGLLSHDTMATEPMIARVNEALCSGCLWCKPICPYKAIDGKIIQEKIAGKLVSREVAAVNSGLCHGCGACTVACRDGAMNLAGFTNDQMLAEVDELLGWYDRPARSAD